VGKIVFWIVVVFGVLFALRLWNASKVRARRKDDSGDDARPPNAVGKMVRCMDCGVFLPQADATANAEGYRCGDAACPNRKGARR
jgi:hypothetical protein